MIIKKIALLVLLFLSIIGFSQVFNGVATYSIKPASFSIEKSKYSKTFKELQEKINTAAKKTVYELTFNQTQSIFITKNNYLSIEKSDFGKRMLDKGLIYTDSKGLKIVQKDRSGTTFLIYSDSRKFEWEILNNNKKIGKYICYKATTNNLLKNGKHQLITAWYCPELPFSFGPLGFGNLPGLILELEIEGQGVYSVKNITLDVENNFDIIKPVKGKKVTEEEYKKISKELYYQHTTR